MKKIMDYVNLENKWMWKSNPLGQSSILDYNCLVFLCQNESHDFIWPKMFTMDVKHPKRANLGLRGPGCFFALYMYNECTINV